MNGRLSHRSGSGFYAGLREHRFRPEVWQRREVDARPTAKPAIAAQGFYEED
jgi:hypothetical protein